MPTGPSRFSTELLQLPPRPTTADLVLRSLGEADVDPARLARVIASDVALSARLLRVANSAAYGMSRTVANVPQAVSLLGTETVLAIAVSASCVLVGDEAQGGEDPAWLWRHGLTAAVAASVVARRVGGSRADAFTAGLLHDLGLVLLQHRDPEAFERTQAAGPSMADVLLAELEAYGTTHAIEGAAALDAWGFPASVVDAVADHHGALVPDRALGRVVRAAELLALEAEPSPGHFGDRDDLERALRSVRIPVGRLDDVLEEIAEDLDALVAGLDVR